MGLLLDHRKRSFIGRKPDDSLHVMLFGADKLEQHDLVMARDSSVCQGCVPKHYCGVNAQWDHVNHKLWNRCDCLGNARTVCDYFHKKRHVRALKETLPPCPGIVADPKFAVLLREAA